MQDPAKCGCYRGVRSRATTRIRHESTPSSRSLRRGDVRERPGTLRGGHDPAESGRLSGQKRREKKRAAEEAAEAAALDATHDALAVTARLAVVTAEKLTTDQLRQLVDDLIERAHAGGHVGNRAAELLLGMARAAAPEDDDPVEDGTAWSDMTPGQRAAARVRLDAFIADREKGLEEGDGEEA
jgi:hypothetical protein